MQMIEYGSKDFDKNAWAAIDKREPLQLIVRGEKQKTLKRALVFYQDYFDARRRGIKKRSTWLKFGYYGIRAPTFWGIYNHAELARMKVSTEEREDCLIVSFHPS
ncbi:MAG TPA: hypothetical protein VGA51_06120 [Casimicrobiaceae bacterium]